MTANTNLMIKLASFLEIKTNRHNIHFFTAYFIFLREMATINLLEGLFINFVVTFCLVAAFKVVRYNLFLIFLFYTNNAYNFNQNSILSIISKKSWCLLTMRLY